MEFAAAFEIDFARRGQFQRTLFTVNQFKPELLLNRLDDFAGSGLGNAEGLRARKSAAAKRPRRRVPDPADASAATYRTFRYRLAGIIARRPREVYARAILEVNNLPIFR